MTDAPRRVLIADDEPGMLLVLRTHLQRRGWLPTEATDGTEALDQLREDVFDAVILDQQMPGLTGVEVARTAEPDVPVFIFSAHLEPETVDEVERLGYTAVGKDAMDTLFDELTRATSPSTEG